jgi:Tfp pilus assembly protein PilF
VSEKREPAPKVQSPFSASIEATFQQSPVSYQILGHGLTTPPGPDQAEAYYNSAGALKQQKRFAEALAAFDRAIALKPDYAEAHNGRAIVMATLNRLAEAVAGFDRAIAHKPDYAEAHNNRAIVLQEQKRLPEALASFERAIALKPDHASVYNNCGDVLRELNRIDEALASYDKAIALKPDFAEAYYNRGIALHDLKRFADALADFGKAIALKPGYAAAYNNRGVVLQDLKRLDEALADFQQAAALTPDFAEACSNQSYCLLQMGRFEEGWRLHEWRKKTEIPVGNRTFAQPLWLGTESIAHKTLFVHHEQGLGDTIQFCRYGKLLRARGARVVMSVQQPLYRLLGHLGPDVEVIKQDETPAAFDYHCPLMSLPLALGTTLENIPSERRYIRADERLREQWAVRLPPRTKPRIGVVWSGSAKHKNDLNRSMDLATIAPLFSADTHWISLQQEPRDGEAALLRQFDRFIHYGDALSDFSDTAALIESLDLVISVDTSVAHLAGAMGKPVWILLPYNSDWRWLTHRDDSPWYPTARLFRQGDARSWEDVIARVHAALHGFARRGG